MSTTHTHSVYDTDKHFQIDPATRELINMTPDKVCLMQYDHGSERITFELPRVIEGHDMTLCNRVRVHGTNTDAKTQEALSDRYDVTDLQVSPASEDVVICSWLIEDGFTQYAGPLSFRVTFECVEDDGTPSYRWSTANYTGLSISPGENSDAGIANTMPSVVQDLDNRLRALEENGAGLSEDDVRDIVQQELEAIPFAEGEGF